MGKLKSYQEQLQEIVDKGINAAEFPGQGHLIK